MEGADETGRGEARSRVVWSLAVPVGLVEALFAERRTQPWLGKIGLALVALVAAFLAVPRAAPATARRAPGAPHPLLVATFALLAGSLQVLAYAMGPSTLHWPWTTTVAADLAVDLAVLIFFAWATGRAGWRPIHSWAAASGALLVYAWLGYSVAHAMKGDADIAGHSLLVVGTIAFSAWAGFRAARAGAREDGSPTPEASAPPA